MHPVVILIPASLLILGPRAWADHLLKKYNKNDLNLSVTAGEFAREILDKQQLQVVKVESTDLGDHYDHRERVVRIARNKFDRKTLTALTTAAHEVAHALQDASDYAPFVWRAHLAKVAQVAGQVGSIILVAVPLFSLTSHRPFPFHMMGATVFGILGTGLVAQLAALPSEFDASFNRALPILRSGYIEEGQVRDARTILVACSMTYIASSMVSILNFWPWFISGALASPASLQCQKPSRKDRINTQSAQTRLVVQRASRKPRHRSAMEPVVRLIGKPLIRCWLQLCKSF